MCLLGMQIGSEMANILAEKVMSMTIRIVRKKSLSNYVKR